MVRGAGIVVGGVLLGAAFASGAGAQPSVPGSGVLATGAWSQAAPAGVDRVAVFVTLKAPVRDRLVGVSSAQAQGATVQRVTVVNNAAVGVDLPDGLALPPGQPVPLQPGGYQIVLSGLRGPLQFGQTFPLHLTFAVSQPIDVVARVAAVGASTLPAPGTQAR